MRRDRTPGYVSFNLFRPTWTSVSFGPSYNRNTTGAVSRMTQTVQTLCPMTITSVTYDVRNANTYTLRLVTTMTGTELLQNLAVSKSLSSGAQTILFDNGPLVIPIGTYYFQLALDSGTATWWDYNQQTWSGEYALYTDAAYDAGATNYTSGLRINALVLKTNVPGT